MEHTVESQRSTRQHISRKAALFIVSLIAVVVLSVLSRDTTAVVTLFGVYCCGNVGAKFSGAIRREE